jgi:hypothetical protein
MRIPVMKRVAAETAMTTRWRRSEAKTALTARQLREHEYIGWERGGRFPVSSTGSDERE